MDAVKSLHMGWRSIRDHRLRSTLTTLGVIIGVGAVITFVTLGVSLQADIVQSVAGENTDAMYVSVGSGEQADLPNVGRGGHPVFTEYDVEQLRRIEGVSVTVPEGGMAAGPIEYRNDSVGRHLVTITTPEYFTVKSYPFVKGQPFDSGQAEVVLNQRAARMFATNVSVGDQITITRAATGEELNATVVGIVRESTDGEPSLVPIDDRPAIYGPPEPFYNRLVVSPSVGDRQRVYPRVIVVATDVRDMEVVRHRVSTYLQEESDARELKPQGFGFEVLTYTQVANQIRQISRTFTTYITGVALISLVVGAIGIANIMLVSVNERTREIGIMKAVGASRRDILELFLVESTLLGLLGAVLGVLVGFVAAYLTTVLIGLPFRFRGIWLVAAVAMGLSVGVAAGLYPAWNAGKVDPIDALRHD